MCVWVGSLCLCEWVGVPLSVGLDVEVGVVWVETGGVMLCDIYKATWSLPLHLVKICSVKKKSTSKFKVISSFRHFFCWSDSDLKVFFI